MNLLRTSSLLALALAVGLLAGCGGHNYHLVPSFTVPAASGNVDVGHDDNGNRTVDLKVHHLAKPQDLTPPATAYVVWIQRAGSPPTNAGVLTVNDDLNGEFKTTTPYKTFDLFVTAEGDPHAASPRGQQVLHQQIG